MLSMKIANKHFIIDYLYLWLETHQHEYSQVYLYSLTKQTPLCVEVYNLDSMSTFSNLTD